MAQTWGANPTSLQFTHDFNGGVPSEKTSVINIRDTTNPNNIYSKFYLQITDALDWLTISTGPISGEVNDFTTAQETIGFSIVTANLAQGYYQGQINFKVIGILADGSGQEEVSSFDFPITLIAYDTSEETSVLVGKDSIQLSKFDENPIQDPIDYDVENISNLDWDLVFNNTKLSITCTDPGVTTAVNGNYTTLSGNIEVTVQIALANDWLTAEVGEYLDQFHINYGPNADIVIVQPVEILIIAYDGFVYDPDAFLFEAIKSIAEAPSQLLKLDSAEAFTITSVPVWLTVTPVEGQYHVELVIKPVATENTAVGSYQDSFIITRVVNAVPVETEIPVVYNLHEYISSPYSTDKFAFTLDRDFINFYSANVDVYFQVKLVAKIYEFYTGLSELKEFPYKIPLYKGSQQFNIGRVIHRLMKNMKEYNDTATEQYKLANVSLHISEVQRSSGEVLREKFINNIQFVAGLTPQSIFNDVAILDVNPGAVRVTPNSLYFLNFMLPDGDYTLTTFKNDTDLGSLNYTGGAHNIFTKKILFSLFQPGDTITVKIEGSVTKSQQSLPIDIPIEKKFLVFPEGKESNHIVWVDEYKLKKAMEFTGDYSIIQDITNVFSEKYIDLLHALEKVDSTKKAQLTINTGWITKSDQVSITSLLSQKKAWLLFDNGDILDLVPISKRVTSVDSQRALISYDITFTINFKDNAQAYTF